jgi:hypothetical protein
LTLLAGCQKDPITHLEEAGARLIRNPDGQVSGVRMLNLKATDPDVRRLAEIPSLQSLSIQECPGITGSGLEAIAQLPELKQLSIILTPVDDAGMAHLAAASQLEVLALTGTPVTDAGLKSLSSCGQLKRLTLNNLQGVTDAALSPCASLKALESLSLAGCQGISGSGLASLKALPALRVIDLTGTKVLSQGAEHLAQIGQVHELVLDTTLVTDDVAAQIARVTGLQRLVLGGAPITDAGLMRLTSLKELRSLDLSGCNQIPPSAWSELLNFPALEELLLTSIKGLTDEEAGVLASIPTLRRVNVANTRFSAQAAKRVKDAIPECSIVFGAEPNTEQL